MSKYIIKVMKITFLIPLICCANANFAQDTISSNIYQRNNKLGIGTTEPNTWLTVINDSSYMDYHTNTSIADFRRIYENSASVFQIYGYPNSDLVMPHVRGSVMLYATSDANDLILCATQNTGQIRFFTQTWSEPNSERMRIDPYGRIGIGTTNPVELLDLNGGLKLGYTSNLHPGTLRWTGSDFEGCDGTTWLSLTHGHSELWQVSGNDIYYTKGDVGIGTDQPNYLLHLEKNANEGTERTFVHLNNPSVSDHSLVAITLASGNISTGIYNSSFADFSSSYTVMPDLTGCAQLYNAQNGVALTVNPTNSGVIKFLTNDGYGTIQEHIRMSSEGNLGIGTSNPENALTIEGNEDEWPGRIFLSIKNRSTSFKSLAYLKLFAGESGNGTSLGHISDTYTATGSPEEVQDYGRLTSSGNGLMIDATKSDQSAGVIKFCGGKDMYDSFVERMRIDSYGNVGIGIKNPVELLDLNGGLKLGYTTNSNSGTLRWTGYDFEGYNGTTWLSLTHSQSELWQVSGNDIYYTKGDVGIGTNQPNYLLHLEKNADSGTERTFVHLNNPSVSDHSLVAITLASGNISTGIYNSSFTDFSTSYTVMPDLTGCAQLYNAQNGVALTVNPTNGGVIKFLTNDGYGTIQEHFRMSSEGNIGVGTSQPAAKLHITDGDIYISDIERGIIMKSPDGRCWRGTVDNSGNLNFVSIDCPDAEVPLKSTLIDTENKNIRIFPNPAQNIVTIVNSLTAEKLFLKVFASDGTLLDKINLNSDYYVKDISKFSAGIYIFQIEDRYGNLKAIEKIIRN